MLSRTAPNFRATSRADFRVVPADSMNVVGCDVSGSLSLEAIQMKRGDSLCSLGIRPALTKCQRRTESPVAHPTQEPVLPWSPIFHQSGSRRSFEEGIATRGAGRAPASRACSMRQSRSVLRDGSTFRILLTRLGLAIGTSFVRSLSELVYEPANQVLSAGPNRLPVADGDDAAVEFGHSPERIAVLLGIEVEGRPPGGNLGPRGDRVAGEESSPLA